MEFDPHDQDIIGLLTKLKDIPGEYPENLLMARRQVFLKRIVELHGGTGGGNSAGHLKSTIASPTTGTLLETALIAAIVVETSAMAYFYRDKVTDFLQTFKINSRTVEEVTPPPAVPTSWEIQQVSPSPAIAATATPATLADVTTVTMTPTGTSIPEMAGNNWTTTPRVSSTPDPKGNNGHHYGQTPKPVRTKENNGKNDKPPKVKDDKPPKPKDDKPPKDKDSNPPGGNNDQPPQDKPPKNK